MPLVSKVYHRYVLLFLLLGSGIQACLLMSFYNVFNLFVVASSMIIKLLFLLFTCRLYSSSMKGCTGGYNSHVEAFQGDVYIRSEKGALDNALDRSMKSIDEIDNVIIS